MNYEKRIKDLEEENLRLKEKLERYSLNNQYSESHGKNPAKKIVIGQGGNTLPNGELKFEVSLKASPGLMFITKLSDGTFVEANDCWCALTGYSRNEITGRTSVELGIVSPENRKAIIDEITSKGNILHREFQIKTRLNEIRNVILSAETIEISGIRYILTTGVDITGRKRVEAELFKTHEMLKSITEGTDDMIAAMDMEFRYTFFNQAYKDEFRKLWGRDIEEGTSMVESNGPLSRRAGKGKDSMEPCITG
jgi:PAS domain S-box-containing protein